MHSKTPVIRRCKICSEEIDRPGLMQPAVIKWSRAGFRRFKGLLLVSSILIVLMGCEAQVANSPATGTTAGSIVVTPDEDSAAEPTEAVAEPNPTESNDNPPTTASAETAVDSNEIDDPGLNLLVAAEGEILLRRQSWREFYPTAFGAVVQRGDLLKLPGGGQAMILCDNLTAWRVPADGLPYGLNGCPRPEEALLVRSGGRILSLRAVDQSLPYLLSPRNTRLLDPNPRLRWHDTGANSYTLEIQKGAFSWKATGVTETEMIYPGDPPLEPGVKDYLLVVTDSSDKSSRNDPTKGLGFELLDENLARQVRAGAEQIKSLGLSSEAEQLAVAQLYAGYGLRAEAIEILEIMIEEDSQAAAVYQSLADLYLQIKLPGLAEGRYLEALALAEQTPNPEAEAAIHAALGEFVYLSLGDLDEAAAHTEAALAGYEALGDEARAAAMREHLELIR